VSTGEQIPIHFREMWYHHIHDKTGHSNGRIELDYACLVSFTKPTKHTHNICNCIMQYSILYYITLYYAISYYTLPYYTVIYYSIFNLLYCITLYNIQYEIYTYYTIVYYTILCYIIL
jgi:hypothetical protein